jgi:hypothetical protein
MMDFDGDSDFVRNDFEEARKIRRRDSNRGSYYMQYILAQNVVAPSSQVKLGMHIADKEKVIYDQTEIQQSWSILRVLDLHRKDNVPRK